MQFNKPTKYLGPRLPGDSMNRKAEVDFFLQTKIGLLILGYLMHWKTIGMQEASKVILQRPDWKEWCKKELLPPAITKLVAERVAQTPVIFQLQQTVNVAQQDLTDAGYDFLKQTWPSGGPNRRQAKAWTLYVQAKSKLDTITRLASKQLMVTVEKEYGLVPPPEHNKIKPKRT